MNRNDSITDISIIYNNDEQTKERFINFIVDYVLENHYFYKDDANDRSNQ